jgi:hypothetical protein
MKITRKATQITKPIELPGAVRLLKLKSPIINLGSYHCAEGFNSGLKGLK